MIEGMYVSTAAADLAQLANTGECFLFGQGVQQNIKKARACLTAAAQGGNVLGQLHLAILYAGAYLERSPENCGEVEHEFSSALSWAEKAAKAVSAGSAKGNEIAVYARRVLLSLYEHAENPTRDPERALFWLEKRVEYDNEGMVNLAQNYRFGVNTAKQNYAKAVALNQRSSFRWEAQENLACLLYRGRGIQADRVRAHNLFLMAAKKESVIACVNLAVQRGMQEFQERRSTCGRAPEGNSPCQSKAEKINSSVSEGTPVHVSSSAIRAETKVDEDTKTSGELKNTTDAGLDSTSSPSLWIKRAVTLGWQCQHPPCTTAMDVDWLKRDVDETFYKYKNGGWPEGGPFPRAVFGDLQAELEDRVYSLLVYGLMALYGLAACGQTVVRAAQCFALATELQPDNAYARHLSFSYKEKHAAIAAHGISGDSSSIAMAFLMDLESNTEDWETRLDPKWQESLRPGTFFDFLTECFSQREEGRAERVRGWAWCPASVIEHKLKPVHQIHVCAYTTEGIKKEWVSVKDARRLAPSRTQLYSDDGDNVVFAAFEELKARKV